MNLQFRIRVAYEAKNKKNHANSKKNTERENTIYVHIYDLRTETILDTHIYM